MLIVPLHIGPGGRFFNENSSFKARFFKFGTYDRVDAHKNISKFQTDLTTPFLAAHMR